VEVETVDGLSLRDLRLLRDVLDPSLEAPPGQLIAQPVLEEIARVIPSDEVTLQVTNSTRRRVELQGIGPSPDPNLPWRHTRREGNPERRAAFWADFWDSPCTHPQRTGDTSILWNGYRPPPPTERGKTVMREFLDRSGWVDEILVPLAAKDTDDHRLLLARLCGPKYTERDMLVLTLVRATVAERHARQVHRPSMASGLTPRQMEILRLVAEGCTNRQIARTLSITEATARTHLVNIYSRLGATNRTQALATAGMLRDPA
jgi:DNA-binding CsgD family transcriptional regulator